MFPPVKTPKLSESIVHQYMYVYTCTSDHIQQFWNSLPRIPRPFGSFFYFLLEQHHPQPKQHRCDTEVIPQGLLPTTAAVLVKVPKECLGGGVGGDVGIGVGFARDDGVDVCETHVVAVEAVGLVDLGDAGVAWFGKGDVDALNCSCQLCLLLLLFFFFGVKRSGFWRGREGNGNSVVEPTENSAAPCFAISTT